MLRPILTYDILIWVTADNSHLKEIYTLKSKLLWWINGADWYVSDQIIRQDAPRLNLFS